MVFSQTAGVLDCHEWRNPWTLWTDDGITWEADLRHAELIRKSFGVTGRSVATPGVRDKLNDIEGEVPIDKEAADRYRANTMRAQYLSSDRPEIQVECRDLARKMQQPPYLDEMGLKRLARFCRSASEAGVVVQVAKGRASWQEEEDTRKYFSIVLILQEKFFTAELFKVIQDAILLILHYRTMSSFRTVSSSTFITSDVQSIYTPS